MASNRSGQFARVEAPLLGSDVDDDDAEDGLPSKFAGVEPLERLEIELLLEAVYRHYGYDFRQYAFSSLRRLLRKRLEAEGLETFSQLQDRVLHDPTAIEGMLRDM